MGLTGQVRLLGYARNPFAILARADMFVSPSHCEGFPNAIAEAMVLGVPVVSTDCPSGPAELLDATETVAFDGVHAGKYGLLTPVGRPDLLAQAMDLMSDAGTSSHYSKMGAQRMEDFRIEAIATQFWDLFDTIRVRGRQFAAPPSAVASQAGSGRA